MKQLKRIILYNTIINYNNMYMYMQNFHLRKEQKIFYMYIGFSINSMF